MLIINSQKLEPSAGAKDHPMHAYWVEYEDGLKTLKKTFPSGKIEFFRPGYPKVTPGIYKDKEVELAEDTPMARFPYKTEYRHPTRGREIWACCVDTPKILQGNLWDLGNKRTFEVKERLHVDIQREADFAFYLYFISNAVKSGQLKVYDPEAEIRARADAKRADLDRNFAIWKQLDDEKTVRMAQMIGIPNATTTLPDALREEIEATLKSNDDKALRDPSIKWTTKEFMNEMKPSDAGRVRIFLRDALDNGLISYSVNGDYKIGDKVLIHIRKEDLEKKFDKLCDFFSAPAHVEDLRGVMMDVMTTTFLDRQETADIRWVAKVMDIEGFYNKPEEQVKQMVYQAFNFA